LSVALIQPNVSLQEKWNGSNNDNINTLLSLSKPYIDKSTDLIIWPESALQIDILRSNSIYINKIQSILTDSTTILSGMPHIEYINNKKYIYNSIISINKNSIGEIYNKIQLVPMAEYVPWSNVVPLMADLNLGQSNFSQGDKIVLYNKNEISYGGVICFESTFPWIFNNFVQKGAEFMVVVTNDGWYETAPEPQQHAKQSIYRAIESRRTILRCANTGISMIINPRGNIEHQLELNTSGTIESMVYPEKRITFYTQYGHKFPEIIGYVILLLMIGLFIKDKSEK